MNEELENIDRAYETFYSALETAREEILELLSRDPGTVGSFLDSPQYEQHVDGDIIIVTEKKFIIFSKQKQMIVGAHEDHALDANTLESKETKQKFCSIFLNPQPVGHLQNSGEPYFQMPHEKENPNAAFDSFAEFAKKCYMDENTDFLKAIAALDYLRNHDDLLPQEQHAHSEAEKIYFEFITEDSPREINLSFKVRDAIKEAYNNVADVKFSRRRLDIEFSHRRRNANAVNLQSIDITKTNRTKRTKNVMTKKNRKGKKFEKMEDNGVYWV